MRSAVAIHIERVIGRLKEFKLLNHIFANTVKCSNKRPVSNKCPPPPPPPKT